MWSGIIWATLVMITQGIAAYSTSDLQDSASFGFGIKRQAGERWCAG